MEQYTDEEGYDDEYSEDEEYKSYDAEEGYQNHYPYYDYNEEEERGKYLSNCNVEMHNEWFRF